MDDSSLNICAYISEENERRKKRRKYMSTLFLATIVYVVAHVCFGRMPKEIGEFNDDEEQYRISRYLLRDMYDGSEVTCYDQLRVTKRSFHDLCVMLREKSRLRGSVHRNVEEKVAMFLHVLGHGVKMRVLRATYKQSL